ncbi:MAG: DUF1385 domain-containing protein [Candidatus Muirbacterium halophilum]|nr:DUF1385 domain-containing protein [Candidatus Muirbacterium halophilum]MCK9475941.1 DUF1385 domain-containing protein [Candidatus Muirbacterium halophilum]
MKEVGGQAVIEGIMMRADNSIALAVRNPAGNIILKHENVESGSKKFPFLKLPIFRGVYSLYNALVIGVKYLTISANIASTKIGEEEEELSAREIFFTLFFAGFLGVFMFIMLPSIASRLFEYTGINNHLYLNVFEGIVRILIFLIYVYSISRLEDIEKVFMYHGAEHKTIYAYENNEDLNLENVRKHSRFHPRCGTSFLMFVMIISMLVFSFVKVDEWYLKIFYKILLMPLVAGLSFEFIKMAGRNISNPIIKSFVTPGLWLQHITTKEPEDEQLEVAIKALEKAVEENEDEFAV